MCHVIWTYRLTQLRNHSAASDLQVSTTRPYCGHTARIQLELHDTLQETSLDTVTVQLAKRVSSVGEAQQKSPDVLVSLITRRLETVWQREADLVGLLHGDTDKLIEGENTRTCRCNGELCVRSQKRNTFGFDSVSEIVVVLNFVKKVRFYNVVDSRVSSN